MDYAHNAKQRSPIQFLPENFVEKRQTPAHISPMRQFVTKIGTNLADVDASIRDRLESVASCGCQGCALAFGDSTVVLGARLKLVSPSLQQHFEESRGVPNVVCGFFQEARYINSTNK